MNEPTVRRRSRVPYVIAAIVILSGFGYLLYGGIAENLVFNITPSALLAQGPEAYNRPVRLGGLVKPGTVRWDADRLGVHFQMQDTLGPTVEVYSTGTPTAMFREGIGVVVEGKYVEENGKPLFKATTLMVKHSNEYIAPKAGEKMPAEMYKSLIKD